MSKIFINVESRKVVADNFERFVKYLNEIYGMNIRIEDELAVFTTKTIYDSATMVEIRNCEEVQDQDINTTGATVTIVERLEFDEDGLCEYMHMNSIGGNYMACEMAA